MKDNSSIVPTKDMKTYKLLEILASQGYGFFLKSHNGDTGMVAYQKDSQELFATHDDLPMINMFIKCEPKEAYLIVRFCQNNPSRHYHGEEIKCTFKINQNG